MLFVPCARKRPKVRITKGTHEKLPSRHASKPAITHEYTVTKVTAERVAISHLETTSRESHSFLSFILMSCHEALRHMAKLMCISLSFCVDMKITAYNIFCR